MNNNHLHLNNINHLTSNPLRSHSSTTVDKAKKILAEIMLYRRMPPDAARCKETNCPQCAHIHLPLICAAIAANKPVSCVLPAFPGKSPNLEKVLGYLPDYAERLALRFLGALCQRVKQYYAPGIKIILCSDGRVFSDVVGMKESHVTAYQTQINKLIDEMSFIDLTTFNLDHYYAPLTFAQMRDALIDNYAHSLASIKHTVRSGAKASASLEEREANRMYRGITRFLFEDSIHQKQTKSRTVLQKESREKAYELIRRSNAWSALIAEHFPDSIRLSIHPQICGSKKLGIRLIQNELWMTPWHGVAVATKNGFILLKRSVAEALGAKLIYTAKGQPSHYQLQHHH
ncbi:MAG: pyoverdine biosynthesis protein PvcA [Legionella sp. 40-6]|nr:isocyanide synthase family protein [Legionella sp.]OJY22904.1 MAG: pyoverdine biosynthesis protein PvcA [Legionella sp. 40-6]